MPTAMEGLAEMRVGITAHLLRGEARPDISGSNATLAEFAFKDMSADLFAACNNPNHPARPRTGAFLLDLAQAIEAPEQTSSSDPYAGLDEILGGLSATGQFDHADLGLHVFHASPTGQRRR